MRVTFLAAVALLAASCSPAPPALPTLTVSLRMLPGMFAIHGSRCGATGAWAAAGPGQLLTALDGTTRDVAGVGIIGSGRTVGSSCYESTSMALSERPSLLLLTLGSGAAPGVDGPVELPGTQAASHDWREGLTFLEAPGGIPGGVVLSPYVEEPA